MSSFFCGELLVYDSLVGFSCKTHTYLSYSYMYSLWDTCDGNYNCNLQYYLRGYLRS